ncbi:MAG: hypothetical protein PHY15_06155 [Eubacteriales bacterium]|nr:hypothetical protein [Eubacteriales bacterium]MDD4474634.1 hypothetical protein [Eubacteriales bacterium]
MSIKEQKKLSDENTAVNRTLKNIEDILEEAQKTTENALAVTRITDTVDKVSVNNDEPYSLTTDTDIPQIVFAAEPDHNDLLVRDFAKKIKKDKDLTGYLTGSKKNLSTDKVGELYKYVNDDEPDRVVSSRLSNSQPYTESNKNYEQTMLFESGEINEESDDELLEEIARASREDTSGLSDDFADLTERILSSDISAFRDDTTAADQLKLSTNDTAESEAVSGSGETLDATDINLRLAFNMLDDGFDIPDDIKNLPDKEIFDKVSHKKKRRGVIKDSTSDEIDIENSTEDQYDGYEYESHEQDSEVEAILRKAVKGWGIKTAIVFVFALGILFLETATKTSALHPIFLKQGRYGMLYALVDLQLLLFIAITMLGSVKKGIRDIFKLAPTSDSLLFISILLPVIHTIYCIFTDPTSSALSLFNLGGAATAFFVALSKLIQSKRDAECFEIISDDRPKYAAESLVGASKEADEFYKYLFDDSALYTVKKTDFISGFFKRITSRAKSDDVMIWQIFIVVIAAVLIFAVSYLRSYSIFDSYKFASALIATAMPMSAIFASVLPTVKANKIARRSESALIGNSFTEEYDSAAVISFADTEVFPSSNIKLTSLKTYGDYRIDKVIQDLAGIFEKLGGPLAEVLSKVVVDSENMTSMSCRLIECVSDGLVVSSGGKDIYIGKRSFMRNYMFEIPYEAGDNEFESGNGSIMYLGINDDLVAKLNLRYRINSKFDYLLKDMYKAGMCVGIKTLDPNISNELLTRNIKFKKCPIAILKADKPEDILGKAESISSAIATNGSLHTFLRMFILCDKTRHSIKSNIVITMASMILSLGIAAFLILTGSAGYLTSVYALLFQLLWLGSLGVITYIS